MDREQKPFRVGIDGVWRDVAEAVRAGAGSTEAIAAAIRRPGDSAGFAAGLAAKSITKMIDRRLLYRSRAGQLELTRRGYRQLGREVEYFDLEEARRLGLTPGEFRARSPD